MLEAELWPHWRFKGGWSFFVGSLFSHISVYSSFCRKRRTQQKKENVCLLWGKKCFEWIKYLRNVGHKRWTVGYVCVFVCVHICMSICSCECVYACVYMCECICMCICVWCVCMHVHMCVCMCICVCACVYVCVSVCTHVCHRTSVGVGGALCGVDPFPLASAWFRD